MKLELKHLAPYLPFKMKYKNTKNDKIYTMRSLSSEINMVDFGWGDAMEFNEVIPILKPMCDILKPIDYDERNISYASELKLYNSADKDYAITMTLGLDFDVIIQLIQWNFDVFGLISKGLAIDINDEAKLE